MKSILNFLRLIIDWCNYNEGFISMILSIITVFISIYVMRQSNKKSEELSEKQIQMEANIALRQEDIERRQIKVDTYPYRLECWEKLYKLKEKVELLKILFDTVDVYKLSFVNLNKKYEMLQINSSEILLTLQNSKNVFPVNTWKKIDETKLLFLRISNNFATFKIWSDILTIEEQGQREAEKRELLKQISQAIVDLLRLSSDVLLLVEGDLCIADLHSWKGIYDKGK